MEVLRADKISFRYSTQAETLLRDVSFSLDSAGRVGLVGSNGSGKTTLLELIRGQIEPTGGCLSFPDASDIGYLPQEIGFPENVSVEDYLWQGLPVFAEVRSELAGTDIGSTRYAELITRYYEIGGAQAEARMNRLLSGFRLDEAIRDRPLAQLSGGEKTKVALTRLLLREPRLLLMDEPTNHLEIESLEWLEQFLSDSSLPFISVSHDRRFLDACTNTIWELHNGLLTQYSGNYSFYRDAKETDRRRRQAEYDRQTARARRLQEAAARQRTESNRSENFKFKRSVSKKGSVQKRDAGSGRSGVNASKQMKSAKALERRIDSARKQAQEAKPFIEKERRINIEGGSIGNALVLEVRDLTHVFDKTPVFSGVTFALPPGARLGIIGRNGSGKTTLIELLAHIYEPTSGHVRWTPRARVAYYAQEHENLNPASTILDEVLRGRATEQTRARTILGSLNIRREKVYDRIGNLSIGERSKTALAKILLFDPDVLLLDEPTNHLELTAREALEDALVDYKGTVLLASHDRYSLERITTSILDLDRGRFYDGGYTDYLASLDDR